MQWTLRENHPPESGSYYVKDVEGDGGGRFYFDREKFQWHWSFAGPKIKSGYQFYWLDETTPAIPEDVNQDYYKWRDDQIKKVFAPMFAGLSAAAMKYFLETGTISGEFFIALQKVADSAREYTLSDSRPIPSSIVRRLEEMNPWKLDVSGAFGYRKDGWQKCVSKLTELLSAQPEAKTGDALAFGKYVAKNGWKPYSENAWEGCDDETASTETLYKYFCEDEGRQSAQPAEQSKQECDNCRSILQELVDLKIIKDKDGKTPEYEKLQPKAWQKAKSFLDKY